MRQRPDFREAKHTNRQLYKDHVESTGEGKSSIHPADQLRQSHRQRFKGFEEYNYRVHPSNWMEILSFNKFVFIRAPGAAQRWEVES